LKTSYVNDRPWLPISFNENGECGEDNQKCYDIPDARNQFTPTIAVIHTLLQRNHNNLAKGLAYFNPHYTDEQLFQEARKINIAQYQNIVYYEWLPAMLGRRFAYENNLIYHNPDCKHINDYDPYVDPAPLAEFAGAAFRHPHNQIPGWFS